MLTMHQIYMKISEATGVMIGVDRIIILSVNKRNKMHAYFNLSTM